MPLKEWVLKYKGNMPLNEWVHASTNGVTTFSDMERRVQNKNVETLQVIDLKNFIKAVGEGSRGNYHKDELVQEVYDIFAKRALDTTNVKVEPYSPNAISPQNPSSNSTLSIAKPFFLHIVEKLGRH